MILGDDPPSPKYVSLDKLWDAMGNIKVYNISAKNYDIPIKSKIAYLTNDGQLKPSDNCSHGCNCGCNLGGSGGGSGGGDGQSDLITNIATFFVAAISHHDPLVLDLDGDGIETIKLNDSNVYFDLDNDGFKEKSGWVSKDDGILIVDENNNGLVDGVSELFGNTTINGFDELKLSDSNNDNKINSLDPDFTKIKIWQDLNENGISEMGELKNLSELNIKSINLNYTSVNQDNNVSCPVAA